MTTDKNQVKRAYPPDYVSAETLAYRLDCSQSTVAAYVQAGLLPKPEIVGNLTRWDFAEVRAFIKGRNVALEVDGDGYMEGLDRATSSQT